MYRFTLLFTQQNVSILHCLDIFKSAEIRIIKLCIRILKGHNRKTYLLQKIKAIAHLLFSKRHTV